ncbi:Uroporphyrinogen decarboxylase (URO-D) [Limihaloglobus sulfuriphilus]|uniref:Uroporphyrinogen decarboxylase (URO-D) n=1 Tax=Limihaloglobus sulfuriphilus TaxID=1851148 RepID=A0A1Q2MC19_9BACT|nr:uroporphyrinogen decarboxylase family protein [Limihaloglobus sulfuriphilus]AQQ70088.1 Uroporphyrinogen decarboxylase (URO-D) [Limihaloglobus sulfuriphilus]
MKSDVNDWALGNAGKILSKETLNHPGIISKVSRLDVYGNTPEAYLRAYEALGIDIINRVPAENAPAPAEFAEKRYHPDKPYSFTSLGVYDTAFRERFEVSSPEDVYSLDIDSLRYDDLIVPVPHPCSRDDIKFREKLLGGTGMYYPMLYTTLFMWAVETLGWENFMVAAITEPQRFTRHFFEPCAEKSRRIVDEIAEASENPFIFLHDDLADANGPVFPLAWYEDCIFPFYKKIFEPAKRRGKKIIFVADGNMTVFLPRLVELGVDGIMCENPATPLESVMEHFGGSGGYIIGGIDTARLTMSSPDDISLMVQQVYNTTRDCSGFAVSSCGGLHGNIPMENLDAYFDARVRIGATPANWRNYFD